MTVSYLETGHLRKSIKTFSELLVKNGHRSADMLTGHYRIHQCSKTLQPPAENRENPSAETAEIAPTETAGRWTETAARTEKGTPQKAQRGRLLISSFPREPSDLPRAANLLPPAFF